MEKKNFYTEIETNAGKAVKGFATFEEAEKYAESNNCLLHYARLSQETDRYEVGDRAFEPYCIEDFAKDGEMVYRDLDEYVSGLEAYKDPWTSDIYPGDEDYEDFITVIDKAIETAVSKFSGLKGSECIVSYGGIDAEKDDYFFTERFDDGVLFTICALPND